MIAPDLQSQDKAVVPEMSSSRSKIFKQKLFLLSLAFLFLAAIVFFFTAPKNKPVVPSPKTSVTPRISTTTFSSTTSAFPAKTASLLQMKLSNVQTKDNTVTGTLRIENNSDTPVSDVFYAVKVTGSTVIPPASPSAFLQVQQEIAAFTNSQVFNIGANSTKDVPFTLPYSPQIADGSYVIYASLLSSSRQQLSYTQQDLKLSGADQYVFLNYRSCKIVVNNIPFDPTMGPLIREQDKATLNCLVKNTHKSPITIYPSLTTAERFVLDFPTTPSLKTSPTAVTLKANEEKTVSVPVPFLSKPQVYEGLLSFTDTRNRQMSYYYIFRWTTPGESAYIQDAKPDKTSYKKGETAKVKLTTAASMDLFWPGAGTMLKNPMITTSLSSGGSVCGSASIPMKQDKKTITQDAQLDIRTDCVNPTVKTTITDESGKVLAEKSQEYLSSPPVKYTPLLMIAAALLIISLLFLLAAIVQLLLGRHKLILLTVLLLYLGCFAVLAFALTLITGFPGKVFADYIPPTPFVRVDRSLHYTATNGQPVDVGENSSLYYDSVDAYPFGFNQAAVIIDALITTTSESCANYPLSFALITVAIDSSINDSNTTITYASSGQVVGRFSSTVEVQTLNVGLPSLVLYLNRAGPDLSVGPHYLNVRIVSEMRHGPYPVLGGNPISTLHYPPDPPGWYAWAQSDHNYLEFKQSSSPNFYYTGGYNCLEGNGMTPCYGEYMFTWGGQVLPSPSIPPLDPIGYQGLETGCDQFVGWACDGSDFGSPINVDFHRSAAGGGLPTVYVGQTTTNHVWDNDSKAICGGVDHGYRMLTPLDLKNGNTYDIYAYGINIGTGNNSLLGNSPRRITCTAPPPPPPYITSFTINGANPGSGSNGATATIAWTTINATSCTDPRSGSGSLSPNSSVVTGALSGPQTYNYGITCVGPGGSANASASITVALPPPVPPTVNLSLTTPNGTFPVGTGLLIERVNQNAAATLNWSISSSIPITSANASSNPVQGYWNGAINPDGSQGITTTTIGSFVFTLTASNAAGSTVKSVQLYVDKYPPPYIQTTGGDVHSNETIYISPLQP